MMRFRPSSSDSWGLCRNASLLASGLHPRPCCCLFPSTLHRLHFKGCRVTSPCLSCLLLLSRKERSSSYHFPQLAFGWLSILGFRLPLFIRFNFCLAFCPYSATFGLFIFFIHLLFRRKDRDFNEEILEIRKDFLVVCLSNFSFCLKYNIPDLSSHSEL